jgi:cyanophycinase-like exopeptidase
MADDRIEAIDPRDENRNSRMTRLIAQYDAYLQQLQTAIDSKDCDVFHSPLALKIMGLGSYLISQTTRQTNMRLTDYMRDHNIQEIKKAYEPTWKQILPIVAQIVGALAGGILPTYAVVGGYTGGQAEAIRGWGQATSSILGSGGSAVGQLTHSSQQALQVVEQNKLDANRRDQGNKDQERQQQLQTLMKQWEELKHAEQNAFQTFGQMTNG